MKRFAIVCMIAALLAFGATAMAQQPTLDEAAQAIVPPNAQFLRTERDDGLRSYHYRTPDGTRWEVKTDPASMSVVRVEIESADTRGSAACTLIPEQAEQALLALWPEAMIHLTKADCDDGRHEYDIAFSTPAFMGKAELNAETGALLEADLNFIPQVRLSAQGPLTADEARELALTLADDGRIVSFETDRDDGRTVYEGELDSNGVKYEFAIDAETGRVTEWEID